MVAVWICILVAVIIAILITVCVASDRYSDHKAAKIVVAWLVFVAIAGLLLWTLYGTETGKRAQKTFTSETSGGLYRTVKVYDMNGELIQEYKGKFDVAENMESGVTKVKFDCDGKRHIIYGSTGTIIIDEVDEHD